MIVFRSPLREERAAALLGTALGVAFTLCFVTGLVSHLIQDPGGWFHWPSRPAGLYRLNQGLHVTTGLVSVPLLLAKLWVVFPGLFTWPPARSIAHAVERLCLLPLVGGSVLLLFTGVANINLYRPWDFSFRSGHYAAAWIVIGSLVVHVGAKLAISSEALRCPAPAPEPLVGGLSRRGFLATVFGSAGLVGLLTVGQTLRPLAPLGVLAPRRPDVGPQGFPVNRTAMSVALTDVDVRAYRLVVDGPGATTPFELTYDELLAMPQHEATLPISCVEGWSTTQTWRGVRVRDLLARAGAPPSTSAVAHAIHESPRLREAPISADHASDRDTLVALFVGGEPLVADHGFPARLIGPNRPGVHQTKWLGRLEVLA